MLFNSYEFILIFLPVTLFIYFFLNKQKLVIASKAWLVFTSLLFYSWWNIQYLWLILSSIIFNFSVGTALSRITRTKRSLLSLKAILTFGVTINLVLLGYYKYTNFFISNINQIAGSDFHIQNIILPLGISFFTFTQIAYLVDAYKDEVKEMDYLNYSLFVTFFPHLLAGPILHHKEMMPQFDNLRSKVLNYQNISMGLFLFCIGLFKKTLIADNLAVWANNGFDITSHLTFFEAWLTSLSYTFQLYFDFSGYTDMALGIAMMFNIFLPINFNSPYKACNIQDFWRRWHITLSRFLRDYIYIPLGGNRLSEFKTCQNLFMTFLIGGLWHGAGWTFIFWGGLHGLALVIHRFWKKLNITMNKFFAWFLTFNFVNICWIFFRAKTWSDALKVLSGMFGFNDFLLPRFTHYSFYFKNSVSGIEWNDNVVILLVFSFLSFILIKNSNQLAEKFKPNFKTAIVVSVILVIVFFKLGGTSEFLYYRF